jgi:aldose sugar dehydrogenase
MKSRRVLALLWLMPPTLFFPAAAMSECLPQYTHTIGEGSDSQLMLVHGPAPVAVRLAGPFDVPWSVAPLPNGAFLVSERPGRLRYVEPGTEPRQIFGVPPVYYSGHGGLLDLAADQNFESNQLIYFTYLQGDQAQSVLRVMRARVDLARNVLADKTVLFEGSPAAKPEMLGARLALTRDGQLFLSMGDRWEPQHAQELSDYTGTVIRIRTDGSLPDDNPFHAREGAKPEIWSYGHRNPQGLAYDRDTAELWSTEHGPQGGDELNHLFPAGNYGWPLATYGVEYTGRPIAVNSHQPGTEQPFHYWVPISIAPSGLAVETVGDETTIWMGSLAGERLLQLTVAGGCLMREQHYFKNELGRIRDVRVHEGVVYFLTDGGQGMLYKLDRNLGSDATNALDAGFTAKVP